MNKQEHDSSAHRGHGEVDRFCCEACFLKQREQHDLQVERDHAYLALAEALDAREHEAGLHSRRGCSR